MRKTVLCAAVMAASPWICRADEAVLTYADIAARLYDFERLATPPVAGERGAAWTSAQAW